MDNNIMQPVGISPLWIELHGRMRELKKAIQNYGKSPYGEYLKKVLEKYKF